MMQLIILLLFVCVFAIGCYGLYLGGVFASIIPEKKTPTQIMQEQINHHTSALQKAKAAHAKSQSHVEQLHNEARQSVQDIARIKKQIEVSIDANDDEKAKVLIRRLESEEDELRGKRQQFEEAERRHHFYEETVREETEKIESLKREAKQLEIRLELARADKELRNAQSDLSAFKTKVDVAELEAEVSRGVPTEDEFTRAADDAAVESRLAEFKKKSSDTTEEGIVPE